MSRISAYFSSVKFVQRNASHPAVFSVCVHKTNPVPLNIKYFNLDFTWPSVLCHCN